MMDSYFSLKFISIAAGELLCARSRESSSSSECESNRTISLSEVDSPLDASSSSTISKELSNLCEMIDFFYDQVSTNVHGSNRDLLLSKKDGISSEKLALLSSVMENTLEEIQDEKSIKEKCSSRIFRLNQCISLQKADYEKKLDKMLEEKKLLETKILESEKTILNVNDVVAALQQDVQALKKTSINAKASGTSQCHSFSDNANLIVFSERLGKVIEEAKTVVAYKDSQIEQLETSLSKQSILLTSRMIIFLFINTCCLP